MNKSLSLLSYRYAIYVCALFIFAINISIFWPGQWTHDSHGLYNIAQAGIYGDAHPPIMSILWRFLLNFSSGSGLMLLFHFALLYTSCIFFMHAFSHTRLQWYYAVYPLLPPVLFYSAMIWKDVSFALSFLLLSSLLTYYAMDKKRPSALGISIMFLLVFYGTAVKFQGIYVAPLMLLGIAYSINNYKLNFRTLSYSIISFIGLYFALLLFHLAVITENQKSNYWKYVKIYDLAGMSIDVGRPLFPEYILRSPQFSFTAVQDRFNYERVDDIVFFTDSPVPRNESSIERDALLSTWHQAIWSHPISYLKHRFWNWVRILTTKPLEKLETLDFSKFGSLGWLAQLKQAAQSTALSWQHYLGVLIFSILSFIRYLFSFIPVFIFLCTYITWGLLQRKRPVGVILFIINASALALVVSLFFFSMASSLRYVYLAVCLVHASHPLAYYLYFNGGRSIDKKKQIPILDIEDATS